jgi:hypothetical protein
LRLKFVGPLPVGATVRATGCVTSTDPLTVDLVAAYGAVPVVVGTATVEGVSSA